MHTDRTLLYLSRVDVEAAGLGMSEIIAALHDMFREKGAGRVEMPPKPGIHTRPDAFIHLGLALADMATAILMYRQAKEQGLGTQLPY